VDRVGGSARVGSLVLVAPWVAVLYCGTLGRQRATCPRGSHLPTEQGDARGWCPRGRDPAALRNLGLSALDKKVKEGWIPRWVRPRSWTAKAGAPSWSSRWVWPCEKIVERKVESGAGRGRCAECARPSRTPVSARQVPLREQRLGRPCPDNAAPCGHSRSRLESPRRLVPPPADVPHPLPLDDLFHRTPSGSSNWVRQPLPSRTGGCTHRGIQPSLTSCPARRAPGCATRQDLALVRTTPRASPCSVGAGATHVGRVARCATEVPQVRDRHPRRDQHQRTPHERYRPPRSTPRRPEPRRSRQHPPASWAWQQQNPQQQQDPNRITPPRPPVGHPPTGTTASPSPAHGYGSLACSARCSTPTTRRGRRRLPPRAGVVRSGSWFCLHTRFATTPTRPGRRARCAPSAFTVLCVRGR